MIYQDT